MVERTLAEVFQELWERNLNSFSTLYKKLWKWRTGSVKRWGVLKNQRETWCCKVLFQEAMSFGVDCGRLVQGKKHVIKRFGLFGRLFLHWPYTANVKSFSHVSRRRTKNGENIENLSEATSVPWVNSCLRSTSVHLMLYCLYLAKWLFFSNLNLARARDAMQAIIAK